jgi:hypothetical protein
VFVGFNWDDIIYFHSDYKGQAIGIKQLSKNVDFNLTMTDFNLTRYIANRAIVFNWSTPFLIGINNFKFESDTSNEQPNFNSINRVLFFGQKYGYREELVNYLVSKSIPIDCYGFGWGTGFVDSEDLKKLIPSYSLNLGISTIGYTKNLHIVKGRDFEVPSRHGLYLTQYHADIDRVYHEGKEILFYRSKENCYRLASEVLSNPSKFNSIRFNGFRKAMNYSWVNRFDSLPYFIKSIMHLD